MPAANPPPAAATATRTARRGSCDDGANGRCDELYIRVKGEGAVVLALFFTGVVLLMITAVGVFFRQTTAEEEKEDVAL